MKKTDLVSILERMTLDEGHVLSMEEEIHLREAFSVIPLLDEKPTNNFLYELENILFSQKIIFEKQLKRIIPWRIYTLIAALFVIILGAGLWIYSQNMSFETGRNKELALELPDHSKIWLNENSSLEYNKVFFYLKRNIEMKGEAYFVVTKGQKFSVTTPTHRISVLGTRFLISERDSFNVSCYEGKVLVESLKTNKKKVLTKGKRFDSDSIIKENQPQWVSHKYVFNNSSLSDVINAIEKEYKISIQNKEICKELIFTGSFPVNDLNTALEIVLGPYDMSWEQIDSKNYKINNN
jgi:Fe2+-dicitrate sensor, membrane component